MALMPLWKSEGVMEGKMLTSNILRNLLTINAKVIYDLTKVG